MSADPYALPPYRAIRFIVAYGTPLAIGIGLLPVLAGFCLTLAGFGVLPALLGVAGGAVLGGAVMSYAEVMHVLTETLISR